MKKEMFLSILIIIWFSCNSQKHAFIESKIDNGFYCGNDKLFTNAFVNVVGDTAFVDLILLEKYPRKLFTDTLIYNASYGSFIGSNTNFLLRNGRIYLCTNQDSLVFGKNLKIKLVRDDLFYEKHNNEYKNYAVWHQYFKEYLRNNDNREDARIYFFEQREKSDIESMIKTYSHANFLIELDKFKLELKSFK